MRKFLYILFGFAAVLVLALVLAWNMVPTWVSHKLSKQTQVDVSIGHIGLSTSSLEVDNFRVGNPPNSILPKALEVEKFTVDVPLTRFFAQNIVINEMTLDNIYLGLEFNSQRSSKGNWSTIMQNLRSSRGEDKKKAEAEGEKNTVLIKKLIITDLDIELAYRSGGQGVRKLQPIRRLELTNVSSEGGLPTAQIMDIVMSEVLREVFSKENLQNMLEGIVSPESKAGSYVDQIKRFL